MQKPIAAAVLAALLGATPVLAQETAQAPETAILSDIFGDAPLNEAYFSREFLAQVPMPQIEEIIRQFKAVIGDVSMVRIVGPGRYLIITETHEVPAQLALDANNDIIGFFLQNPIDRNASVDDLIAGLEASGADAYLVTRNDETLGAKAEGEALAVGSAFKLGVLAVLNDQIVAGERSWRDVVALKPEHRSLPTGMLQTFPPGSPLTVHTLAALMISQSDNTATDALLELVGPEAVQQKLGLMWPPLSTRAFFVLKADAPLRARYIGGGAEAKRAVVAETLQEPLPSIGGLTPHDEGVEWYIPATTLCAMMAEVGGLDVMHINPGVAQPGDWRGVAYKGGSEVGVLNLTTRAIAEDGTDYCVTATWNEPAALPEAELTAAYGAVIAGLARQ